MEIRRGGWNDEFRHKFVIPAPPYRPLVVVSAHECHDDIEFRDDDNHLTAISCRPKCVIGATADVYVANPPAISVVVGSVNARVRPCSIRYPTSIHDLAAAPTPIRQKQLTNLHKIPRTHEDSSRHVGIT